MAGNVGQPEVMARIETAEITSGLLVIWGQWEQSQKS
jgi:hypothetical protein